MPSRSYWLGAALVCGVLLAVIVIHAAAVPWNG